MTKRPLYYLMALAIPAAFALNAWQSVAYAGVSRELKVLEKTQSEWIESNKRLIAGISVLSSAERIERLAIHELKMKKIQAESVTHVMIAPGGGSDG
jgi:cell division protein FtsL